MRLSEHGWVWLGDVHVWRISPYRDKIHGTSTEVGGVPLGQASFTEELWMRLSVEKGVWLGMFGADGRMEMRRASDGLGRWLRIVKP
jgi:hypothetical protein